MTELLLRNIHAPDVTRVLLIGALNGRTAAEFREQMSHLITARDTPRRLVLDLRCCTHADDRAGGAWAAACATAQAAGKELSLDGVPPLIEDCLRIQHPGKDSHPSTHSEPLHTRHWAREAG